MGFRSDLLGLGISQQNINEVGWEDWLFSPCLLLLIHGQNSFVLDSNQAALLVSRRPDATLSIFEQCGHNVHSCDPDRYFDVVNRFLIPGEVKIETYSHTDLCYAKMLSTKEIC
ncbi:hypothetical protein MH117_26170 [Paenibacillus sp. ACRRX]|uniref:alpha/beta fold hydrolase n=1 Tax=Paenibacillus sp. ACRRX TaxID=2918206 RepID=UPI001EF6D268|nr:hypothetical protein [Paenibacillus sp. ACRRX]MCG7410876.1 hypothetical protein [Paenibacillus sp. ACRRX]